jgi:ABC-type transporter Mla maintaining outer membrane lipid asymmetry ATPase subunit MlaF
MVDVAVTAAHAPDLTVVDHVKWTIHAGDYWVIGGLPASGKSDLLATAAGLMRPGAGVVRLFGKELGHLHEDERRQTQLRVGMVFGDGGRLFNHLSVMENLSLPLCYHQNCAPTSTQERVGAVLELMGLAEVAHETPVALTRNMRQRVALARALILKPDLLFLDNPIASVDPREARWTLDFLKKLLNDHPVLEGRHATLVASTDDLQPWSDHEGPFAVLDRGRFLPVGPRSELLKLDTPALRQLLPVDWLRQ